MIEVALWPPYGSILLLDKLDYVHVFAQGKVLQTGDSSLAQKLESQEKEYFDSSHDNYSPSNIGSMVCPPANIDPIELDTFQIATEMADKVLALLPDKDWKQVQDEKNQNQKRSQIGNEGMEEPQNDEMRGAKASNKRYPPPCSNLRPPPHAQRSPKTSLDHD